MKAGRLNKQITLQKPNLVPDGSGGQKPAVGNNKWVDVATVWAEFENPDLKTAEIAGTIASELTRKINIRRMDDVRQGWRFLHGTRKFNIMHAYDHAFDKGKTVLVCREVVK